MALYNQSELAKLLNVTPSAVRNLIRSGKLTLNSEKKIDTESVENKKYLDSRGIQRALRAKQKKIKTIGQLFDMLDSSPDALSMYGRQEIEKFKMIMNIMKEKNKLELERNELVHRKAIETVFDRLYAIDNNQFKQLSNMLAPDIATIFKIADKKIILQVREIIDNEVSNILKQIKIELNKFLKSINGKEIK